MSDMDGQFRLLLHLAISEALTERLQDVLDRRYGLSDGRPRTLEEVGTEFGLTRERIRRLQEKALNGLRTRAGSQRRKGAGACFDLLIYLEASLGR